MSSNVSSPQKTQVYNNYTLVRRFIHSFVVLHTTIALLWFSFRCAQAFFYLPHLQELEFVDHGYRNMGYFFSLWVSGLQFIYFAMYATIDLLEIRYAKRKDLRWLIDWMHSAASYLLFTIIFPFSLTVGILFWSMYHWDRTYIYPPLLDEWVSPWPNHVMHTIPIPLSILYMLISNKKEPSKMLTLSGLMVFLGIYTYLFMNFKMNKGKWIYLSLEYLTPTQVQWVLSFAFLSPIVFHFLGYKIHDCCKISKINPQSTQKIHSPTDDFKTSE